jgi:glutamate N-acetyltransferase / amino-acid N-acetyltransferase
MSAMAVNLSAPADLLPVAGVTLGVASAAIKKAGRDDLLVIRFAPGTVAGGVFTQNAFAAAPVQICRNRLASGTGLRALLINSGNANAATGKGGDADAETLTAALAAELDCDAAQVWPFSTGVIGVRLPVGRMIDALPHAVAAAQPNTWDVAAKAIMTTDTVAKGVSRRVETSRGPVTVTGIAKGVGMIYPNMATLLAVVATDAPMGTAEVQALTREAADRSFNCVTVDSDTSTNDSFVIAATGALGGEPFAAGSADAQAVRAAIFDVCETLAQAIARDGEGATRFVTIDVDQAKTRDEARQVAMSIANSPLVKTALFAGDANWGRLVMAIGKAGVEGLDPSGVDLRLDALPLLAGGQPHPDYTEAAGTAVLAQPEYTITVSLGRGEAAIRCWTCDFSYDYVKINAEYRT